MTCTIRNIKNGDEYEGGNPEWILRRVWGPRAKLRRNEDGTATILSRTGDVMAEVVIKNH